MMGYCWRLRSLSQLGVFWSAGSSWTLNITANMAATFQIIFCRVDFSRRFVVTYPEREIARILVSLEKELAVGIICFIFNGIDLLVYTAATFDPYALHHGSCI
ncbi:MAG: hypothetical protein IPN29_02445 [Saprospiraceae bacterium]|nr:hypothetical protein [Saprospiraceae bacterium]